MRTSVIWGVPFFTFERVVVSSSEPKPRQEKSVGPDECVMFRQLRERKGGIGPTGRKVQESSVRGSCSSRRSDLSSNLMSIVTAWQLLIGAMDDDEDFSAARGAFLAQARAAGIP